MYTSTLLIFPKDSSVAFTTKKFPVTLVERIGIAVVIRRKAKLNENAVRAYKKSRISTTSFDVNICQLNVHLKVKIDCFH